MILKIIGMFMLGMLVEELINMNKLKKLTEQLWKIYKADKLSDLYRSGIRYALEQVMRIWR